VKPSLMVHGGAGRIGEDRFPAAIAGVEAAARAGLEVLASGRPALDAVQAAVRSLEDCPEFNAGTGSVLTRDGTIEVDASIMDGATRRVGGVGAVPDLGNAVDLARAILDDGEHVLLVGPAAWVFARERGFKPAPPGSLITERSRQRFDERAGGTVGAVAIDGQGRCAAATSTGGIFFKRPGRVGDSPLPGCGTWADRFGAASATGDGERIIQVTLTRRLIDRFAAGTSLADAARDAIADLVGCGGSGGVIAVDRHGNLVSYTCTETMPVAEGTVDEGEIRITATVTRAPGSP
jgi:beta-aspartyl-peptidase (threonine type)